MANQLNAWPASVVVVIPVYRPAPTPDEAVAFARCLEILGRHPIVLVAPEGLALGAYTTGRIVGVERFAPGYFAGIAGYNRLLLDPRFYERFLAYRHLLIYQLDAFVFADRLAEWCAAGYDYVGAPWVGRSLLRVMLHICRTWPLARPRLRGLRNVVGNGGLSLRDVSAHLESLALLGAKARRWDINEDYFWSLYVRWRRPAFRIPDYRRALAFAFETEPAACLALNRGALPFGCHGWDRHGRGFWRPIFRHFGYRI
ncbi:MAG: hypothetical protein OHK0015_06280 [Chloroflexi bacterium OHK40]